MPHTQFLCLMSALNTHCLGGIPICSGVQLRLCTETSILSNPAVSGCAQLPAASRWMLYLLCWRRGPEQIVQGDQHPGHRKGKPEASHGGVTAWGREELAGFMQPGLGDHILMLRLYQVGRPGDRRGRLVPATASGSSPQGGSSPCTMPTPQLNAECH